MRPATIPCPSCRGSFNPGMKACPFCGADRVLPVSDAPVDCPLCKCVLKETAYADETVDVCPRCKGLMVRQNFRGISGVLIDWCGDHGAWFDEKELDHVRAFVANGGVDQSQDREIARNKDEIGGLRSRVGDLEMMEKILNKWDIGRIRYRDF